jgi:hypothetical protein
MSTRDLIDALVAGDSIAIENNFSAVMSDKVSDALDTYKVQVAHNMFATQEELDDEQTEE